MKKQDWIALAALFLLGLGLRAPIAGIFLERDEGEYAYVAQRWLKGEVPYRDSFDQKPPGVFAAYAAIERVSSGSPAAIHWGAQLYTLLTLCLVFLLGRRLFGEAAGFAAGALAAFMTADHSLLGNSANCETFMLLPLAAAFLAALLAKERDSWRWAMASGACAGLSLLFKQVALTDALFYLALLILARDLRRKRSIVTAFVGGAAAVWVPVAAYFAAKGAWGPFYDCVVGYNLSYAGGIPPIRLPEELLDHLLTHHPRPLADLRPGPGRRHLASRPRSPLGHRLAGLLILGRLPGRLLPAALLPAGRPGPGGPGRLRDFGTIASLAPAPAGALRLRSRRGALRCPERLLVLWPRLGRSQMPTALR